MNNNNQGSYITIALAIITIINILSTHTKGHGNTSACQECIHCLDDFLWSLAGIATQDGSPEQCDEFLRKCGYRDRRLPL